MNGILRVLNRAALGAAGTSVLLMTLLGGIDVLGTVVFNRPLPAAYEATEALMVLVVFLALAHLQASRGHIAVDIVSARLPLRVRRVIAVGSQLMAAAFFGVISWKGWESAWTSLLMGEYAAGIVPFPLYPGRFGLAIGAALAAVQALHNAVGDVGRRQSARSTPIDASE